MICRADWTINEPRFIAKKLLDCVVYCLSFILIVYTNHTVINIGVSSIVMIVPIMICIGLSVQFLYTFTQQIASFKNIVIAQKKEFLFIFISILVGILMSLATINYAFYMLYPDFYAIQGDLSFFETAFEFVYYSFTLAVTYSSSSISVSHIVTKLVQMIEICYCYVVFGIIVIELISKHVGKENELIS